MEGFVYFGFILFLGVFIFILSKNIKEWHKNNNSPRLTVNAMIVAKRRSSHHHHNGGTTHSYHVTFQFESGDRLEMRVPRGEFGVLVEGDRGNLTLQGTRYISFERIY
jgi:hypothetical protein